MLNIPFLQKLLKLKRDKLRPIVSYLTALKDLASTCSSGVFLDEMLRDQIVEKTNSPKVREKLLMKNDLKLSTAVTLARNDE